MALPMTMSHPTVGEDAEQHRVKGMRLVVI
jgi:hypothetical protein